MGGEGKRKLKERVREREEEGMLMVGRRWEKGMGEGNGGSRE